MYIIYRGDTFYKKLSTSGYVFQPDDVIHVAIMQTSMGGILYEKENKITEESTSFIIDIPASETAKLTPGILVLEIELTYGKGLVKTQQYEIVVKADGIRG